MKMCQRHWGLLRDAIKAEGLYDLVAPDGRQAMRNMASELQSGAAIQNFDPLMAAHNDIWSHAMDLAGLAVMAPDADGNERCPVCFCAELHLATCPDRPCPDPTFDGWTTIAARHSKETYERLLADATPDDAARRSTGSEEGA